jgi:DNA polymerase III epsilon subunit-like protein
MWPDTFAVFDIETDGLLVSSCMITEVAVDIVVNGKSMTTWSELVYRDTPVPQVITDLTGIDMDLCHKYGKPINQVMSMFWSLVQFFPLIGHNIIKFDIPIIDRFRPEWSRKPIVGCDTTHLFRYYKRTGKIAWPVGKEAERMLRVGKEPFKYNLKVACDEFGIHPPYMGGVRVQHRAGLDVELNKLLYFAMKQRKTD